MVAWIGGGSGEEKGGIINGQEETSEGDGYVHHLDCGVCVT